jgi:O-antigen/teichoic acid export membrane protein
MSGLKGIAKNLTASFSSHLVAVLQQVALTPLFVRGYGVAGLGEWMALSASVQYLGTLDFGIQTFVNQDLTVRYHRGDMQDFHVQQSTALRMLLGIVLVAGLVGLAALLMPLEHWLKMDAGGDGPVQTARIVRGTVYVLALTVLANILFGFFSGQFMVLGKAYVGQYWTNAKNASMILFAVPFLWVHASFLSIALAQLTAVLVCLAGVLATLFRIGRDIFPTLRYWEGSTVGAILRPSGYFALIFSSNFLVYQLPVLILQRGAGPVAVAIFTVTRTIFSMTRNVMNAPTQAIGPEVTTLYAKADWPRLSRLYDYSERLVFALIPIANIGTLFLCPLLLTIWLHKPQMFLPPVYVLCAAVSIVMSAKEHKFQFQFSTNTHRELARFMFVTYLGLVAMWWVSSGVGGTTIALAGRAIAFPRFGINGVLWPWFLVEIVQVLYIMHLNNRFFAHHETLDVKYPVRMTLLSLVFLAGTLPLLPRTAQLPLPEQAVLAIGVGLLLLALDIPLFGLIPVWSSLRLRLRERLARTA